MKKAKYVGASDAQVKWGGHTDPRGILTKGSIYEIEREDGHNWHTNIFLSGFPEMAFPSVVFEFISTEQASRASVPLVNKPDGWPRTNSGVLVRPGSDIKARQCRATIRKIYDGGEYGYCAEIENEEGPQVWVKLTDCE